MKRLVHAVGVLLILSSMPLHATGELQPMTIQLNWITNVEFAGILLAKERGWYEEAGIDLTIKGWESGVTTIDDVATGKIQFGVVEGNELIAARAKGVPVKAIGTQFQKSPQCLISKKEQGIDTPQKLAGKKVGIKGSVQHMMVSIILENQGLQFDDIIPIEIGWELQPLLDDTVDVTTGYMGNEPLILKEKGYEVNLILPYEFGYDFYSAVYIVSESLIQEQPETIEKFLEMTFRGWREAFRDPAATVQLIVENYYPEGSMQQQTRELEIYQSLATLGVGEELLGMMGELIWKRGIDILHQYEQIEQKIPVSDVFTIEFLKNVYRRK